MSDLLPVTQADRDAVQAFHRIMAARLMNDIASGRRTMGEDEGDAGTLVQAFAAHRLAALDSHAGDAGEAVAWCSPGQLANLTNVDRDAGVYLPIRKTKRGNFTMPLFATPAPAVDAVPAGEVERDALSEAIGALQPFADADEGDPEDEPHMAVWPTLTVGDLRRAVEAVKTGKAALSHGEGRSA